MSRRDGTRVREMPSRSLDLWDHPFTPVLTRLIPSSSTVQCTGTLKGSSKVDPFEETGVVPGSSGVRAVDLGPQLVSQSVEVRSHRGHRSCGVPKGLSSVRRTCSRVRAQSLYVCSLLNSVSLFRLSSRQTRPAWDLDSVGPGFGDLDHVSAIVRRHRDGRDGLVLPRS